MKRATGGSRCICMIEQHYWRAAAAVYQLTAFHIFTPTCAGRVINMRLGVLFLSFFCFFFRRFAFSRQPIDVVRRER